MTGSTRLAEFLVTKTQNGILGQIVTSFCDTFFLGVFLVTKNTISSTSLLMQISLLCWNLEKNPDHFVWVSSKMSVWALCSRLSIRWYSPLTSQLVDLRRTQPLADMNHEILIGSASGSLISEAYEIIAKYDWVGFVIPWNKQQIFPGWTDHCSRHSQNTDLWACFWRHKKLPCSSNLEGVGEKKRSENWQIFEWNDIEGECNAMELSL